MEALLEKQFKIFSERMESNSQQSEDRIKGHISNVIQPAIRAVQEEVLVVKQAVFHLQQEESRKNLVLFNFPRPNGQHLCEEVIEHLANDLGLDDQKIEEELDAAFYLGKGPKSPVLLKFYTAKMPSLIISKAHMLKGKSTYVIAKDKPEIMRTVEKEHKEEIRAGKANGDKPHWKGHKFFIGDKQVDNVLRADLNWWEKIVVAKGLHVDTTSPPKKKSRPE